jgi:undecaprenyl-diphosphatase
MDHALLHAVNGLAWRHDWIGDPAELYAKASEALFATLLVVLVVLGVRERRTLRAALLAGAAAATSLAVAVVLSRLVDRPRPFVGDAAHVHLLVGHGADPGFPSDHATAAFAIATALLLYHRRSGIAALIAAALLAVDRVAVGVHYPGDVLAGAALGALAALALHRLATSRIPAFR